MAVGDAPMRTARPGAQGRAARPHVPGRPPRPPACGRATRTQCRPERSGVRTRARRRRRRSGAHRARTRRPRPAPTDPTAARRPSLPDPSASGERESRSRSAGAVRAVPSWYRGQSCEARLGGRRTQAMCPWPAICLLPNSATSWERSAHEVWAVPSGAGAPGSRISMTRFVAKGMTRRCSFSDAEVCRMAPAISSLVIRTASSAWSGWTLPMMALIQAHAASTAAGSPGNDCWNGSIMRLSPCFLGRFISFMHSLQPA